ncbi:MAG: sigma-54-dependent Fis family transcriptional regulator, partial [Myxococcales bacterium]|nr:sigma-54-dependent Fis family transcriptional regulator [Myxococcales bacterium]
DRAAQTDVSVLIEGETGTGKELTARSIHGASVRAKKPFVVFDCASVPPNLAESELFGHVRGAFSGAVSSRAGAFQRAAGGTLFLDEMGELPEALQPKLLRVLESGEVRSVGSDEVTKVDVRLLAATNRDLHAEAQRGRFRSDLLYRLDVVRVRLPPLRRRPEDIPGLIRDLLMGHQAPGDSIDGPNLRELVGYHWPGNVRELRNVLRRAVTLSATAAGNVRFDGLIFDLGPVREPAAFGLSYPGVAQPLPFKEAKQLLLEDFERRYVDALMDRHDANLTHAAKAAGLSRKHLYDLLRKYFPEAR